VELITVTYGYKYGYKYTTTLNLTESQKSDQLSNRVSVRPNAIQTSGDNSSQQILLEFKYVASAPEIQTTTSFQAFRL